MTIVINLKNVIQNSVCIYGMCQCMGYGYIEVLKIPVGPFTLCMYVVYECFSDPCLTLGGFRFPTDPAQLHATQKFLLRF